MLSGGFQPGLISHLSLPAPSLLGGFPLYQPHPGASAWDLPPFQHSQDWHPCFTRVSAHMSPPWSLQKDFCPLMLLYYSTLTNTAFKPICLLFYCASSLEWDLRGDGDLVHHCEL